MYDILVLKKAKRRFVMVEEFLRKMNIEIPAKVVRGGVYKPVMQSGNQLYVSGQGCTRDGKPVYQGTVGKDVTLEEAQDAARICAINALAALKEHLGTLDGIRLVKTLAFVASDSSFSDQHLAANGCSEFLKSLYGDDLGVGARSAIGVAKLPGNIPVEIEFVFELLD